MSDEARAAALLETLTGFPYAVFCQHGTAALELALSSVAPEACTVGVPALGCWTVSHAASRRGRSPVFDDVGEYWSASAASTADARIAIAPWGAPAERASGPCTIADLTLAPGSRLDGNGPAADAVAGIISFGAGKPISLGGGGVALFREVEHARRAASLFRFGFHDGRWCERVDRFSWSHHLFAPLLEQLVALPPLERAAEVAETRRAKVRSTGCRSNDLPPGGAWGHEAVLPVSLPAELGFSPAEVERIATCSGVRAVRHPVSPAYLEPAWDLEPPLRRCSNAEAIADRLLVLEDPDENLAGFAALVAALGDEPSDFRFPYPLPRASGVLRAEIERLVGSAVLVRDVRRSYGLFDPAGGVLWPLSEREASIVQARMLEG